MHAVVITVSDSRTRGERQDLSGPAVAKLLRTHDFDVPEPLLVSDDQPAIEALLLRQCELVPLVVTTGGTGIGRRDVTPEATLAVCDRVLPGFAERMRLAGSRDTPLAYFSRSITGTRGRTLIVNLPGSPSGAVSSLEAVIGLIPHALTLLSGREAHSNHEDAATAPPPGGGLRPQ